MNAVELFAFVIVPLVMAVGGLAVAFGYRWYSDRLWLRSERSNHPAE
jgi:hypothetical protein